jgi:hypothetical protein
MPSTEPEQQECQQQSALPEKPRSPAQHEHTDTPAVDVPILPTPDKVKDGPNIFTMLLSIQDIL